jgi:hypothetical protein
LSPVFSGLRNALHLVGNILHVHISNIAGFFSLDKILCLFDFALKVFFGALALAFNSSLRNAEGSFFFNLLLALDSVLFKFLHLLLVFKDAFIITFLGLVILLVVAVVPYIGTLTLLLDDFLSFLGLLLESVHDLLVFKCAVAFFLITLVFKEVLSFHQILGGTLSPVLSSLSGLLELVLSIFGHD